MAYHSYHSVTDAGGVQIHKVDGSGMGSCFCALSRLITLRTITSTATAMSTRAPITTTRSSTPRTEPTRPIQNVLIWYW